MLKILSENMFCADDAIEVNKICLYVCKWEKNICERRENENIKNSVIKWKQELIVRFLKSST